MHVALFPLLLVALVVMPECHAAHDPARERRRHEWYRKLALETTTPAKPSSGAKYEGHETRGPLELALGNATPSETIETGALTLGNISPSSPSSETHRSRSNEPRQSKQGHTSPSSPSTGSKHQDHDTSAPSTRTKAVRDHNRRVIKTLALENTSPSAPSSGNHKLQVYRMPLLLQEGNEVRRLQEEEQQVEEVKEEVQEEEEERNITLTKELLTGLLQELTYYLKKDRFLVLYPKGERDLCVGAARMMYQQGRPTTCRPRSTTPSDIHAHVQPAVVYLAALQDKVLRFPGSVWGRGPAPHLVLFLPHAPTTLTLAPSPPVNLCVIYPKGDTLAFAEVFTFGRGRGPLLGAPVWAWEPDNPRHPRPPYRGDIIAPTDFMGHIIRVAVIQAPPYVMLGRDAAGVLHPKGYLVDILKVLQVQLNFTIRYVEAKDGQFGLPSANGSWTGLVGVLHRGEADVALGSLSYLASRAAVMDFSPHVDYSESRVLVLKKGDQETIDWLTYVNVFHWSVWVALVGVWAAASVGVVFVSSPEPHITFYNFLFSFAGAYAQQGSEVQPTCYRGRMVFWGLWAGSVLLYASYTALLTSRLAVVPPSRPFRDIQDALTSAGYSITAQRGSSYLLMMQTSRDPGLQLLHKRLQEDPELTVTGSEEGIRMVQENSKTGFLQEMNSVNYALEGDCAFSWEGPKYFPEYTFLGYRKNLPYATALNAFISRSADMGILNKLRSKWWAQDSSCASSSQSFLQLGFNKVVFAFFVLSLGMGAGLVVLLVERWTRRHHHATFSPSSTSSSTSSSSSSTTSLIKRVIFKRRKKEEEGEVRGRLRGVRVLRGERVMSPYLPHLRHLPPSSSSPLSLPYKEPYRY